MEKISATTSKPVKQAWEAWEAAVEAVLQDIGRTAKGGQSNPAATYELMAAVEVARLCCEEVDRRGTPLISPKLGFRETPTR